MTNGDFDSVMKYSFFFLFNCQPSDSSSSSPEQHEESKESSAQVAAKGVKADKDVGSKAASEEEKTPSAKTSEALDEDEDFDDEYEYDEEEYYDDEEE